MTMGRDESLRRLRRTTVGRAQPFGADATTVEATNPPMTAHSRSGLRRQGPVAALLVVLLMVVGDLGLHRFAVHRITTAADCTLKPTSLTVGIETIQLLPHLVTGSLGTVHLRASGAHIESLVASLDLELDNVSLRGRIGAMHGTATVIDTQLAAQLRKKSASALTLGGNGHQLLVSTTVRGVPATVAAKLTIDGTPCTSSPIPSPSPG